jgi:hypothetical protein
MWKLKMCNKYRSCCGNLKEKEDLAASRTGRMPWLSLELHKAQTFAGPLRGWLCVKSVRHTLYVDAYIAQWGHAVAQLVRYESEAVGSIPDDITEIFHWHNPSSYVSRADSASNRNYYQEYFLGFKGGRCVGLTTLLSSCADCHEIWEPQPPGTLRTCPDL